MVMHPNLMISGAMAVFFAVTPIHAVADVVDIANSIRSKGCAEMPAVDQPLRTQVQLAEAARRIARGHELKTATSESGYRAKKFASIHIRTNGGDSDVAQILVQRFCDIVADKSLQDVGVFRRGEDTWMVLAMPLAPPEEEDVWVAGRRVLELINEARAKGRRCGRRKFAAATPLKHDVLLERAARVHAEDMAAHNLRGHAGSDGSMPAGRATRAGYSWAAVAENVAGGQTTADEVVDTWLDSPGHCANLMDPRYSESGVARVTDSDSEHVVYWVQVFAAPE
jgi:uncharacterized protein YkwD